MSGKSKLYSVRVPSHEVEAFEAVLAKYPGASPARIVRALVLTAAPLTVGNALTKHSAATWKGGAK